MTKETKAEKIFRATYTECRAFVKRHGYETNPDGKAIGYNSMITEGMICTRTLNAIEKLLNSERKQVEMSLKYGVIDNDKFTFKMQALDMVESTIKNTRKTI